MLVRDQTLAVCLTQLTKLGTRLATSRTNCDRVNQLKRGDTQVNLMTLIHNPQLSGLEFELLIRVWI